MEYESDKTFVINVLNAINVYTKVIPQEKFPQEQTTRIIRRHIKEHYADEVRSFMKTERAKSLSTKEKKPLKGHLQI